MEKLVAPIDVFSINVSVRKRVGALPHIMDDRVRGFRTTIIPEPSDKEGIKALLKQVDDFIMSLPYSIDNSWLREDTENHKETFALSRLGLHNKYKFAVLTTLRRSFEMIPVYVETYMLDMRVAIHSEESK